jgi:glutathione reductase (NADPH)
MHAAAIAAGRKLAHRLFEPGATAVQSYDDVPSVVFSLPPAGTCGLTEEDAVAKYGADKVKIYKTRYVNMYHCAGVGSGPGCLL